MSRGEWAAAIRAHLRELAKIEPRPFDAGIARAYRDRKELLKARLAELICDPAPWE